MKKWEVLNKKRCKSVSDVVKILLENRGIKTEKQKSEFFTPTDPMKISLDSLGISKSQVKKAIDRILKAKDRNEHVIVYGDYDADGITGTAIMWETLHTLGLHVLPHIPERFSEGYGLNIDSVKNLKEKDPDLGLIITVDHGIVAGKKVGEVKKLGIDMIITDHHQEGRVKTKPLALVHTTKIGGSALAWILAREIAFRVRPDPGSDPTPIQEKLQLAAIGTVADQLPLMGPNRSIVSFGLDELNKTKRPGLLALFEEAGITDSIGTYEVGFVVAPRINAMGRIKHGLESLRLLCTTDNIKAGRIAGEIAKTNLERQKIVDEVVTNAVSRARIKTIDNVIVMASEDYHEGVIGLAASRLVEEFYRPAIVLSTKGDIAKASARSISGFNIIEAIRSLESLYIEGGGHTMAAGFSIKTSKIKEFSKGINKYAKNILTPDILSKKLKIDLQTDFSVLSHKLVRELEVFEPSGIGNPTPVLLSLGVEVVEVKPVGRESKHLKMKLKQNGYILDSIFFGGGENYSNIKKGEKVDVVYRLSENSWNGRTGLQLIVRDLR